MEITETVCKSVLGVVDHGLCAGRGAPKLGEMCVEAAVTFALGEPFSDEPSCVDPVLRRFKINLNDRAWSSNEARAKGLRRIAIAQLGTRWALDSKIFTSKLSEMTIRKIVPLALKYAAKLNPKFKEELTLAANKCEQEGTKESALEAKRLARKVRDVYAADAAADAAAYATAAAATAAAAYDAAYAAAAAYDAAYAAADAAYAAADAAAAAADAAAAAADAAADAERDKILSFMAEEVVQILIEMETPGSKFVDVLTEKPVFEFNI